MTSDEPRPLSARERSLLEVLLAHDFLGVEALRMQAPGVRAKRGCECGCGTIELVPAGDELPRSTAQSPVPAEGQVLDADGKEIGGLLLFLTDGLLSSLEVYSNEDPLPLPSADRVRWTVINR